jgi:hypothetical protein
VLLIYASNKIAPSGQERASYERSLVLPSHLPENTSAGVGTLKALSLFDLLYRWQVAEVSMGRSLHLSG